ncbi:SPOR domain-containing protein [Legionella worsleiensis]|uniref:Sporulation related domain protein n=1 Tax=Legionella worsleiensis TaxID=45076 RepID=A0A0W1A9F5_9GAMM|nr:SPOR domain-containing protein [Legionella worsleiensis]KTD77991.1 Sporulation related domain protein [Legionella worsleiensis]STY31533.1 Opacity protein and related surface antigens [Legionella worsleiensis]
MRFMALKWTHLLIASSLCVAHNANALMIYGLDKAKDFHSGTNGPFTVQAGSFKSLHNANQFKNRISSQTKYPVVIQSKGAMHVVFIGPLQTAKEVRNVGRMQTPITPSGAARVHASVVKSTIHPDIIHQEKPLLDSNSKTISHQKKRSTYLGIDAGLVSTNSPDFMTVNNGSNYPPPEHVDSYSVDLNRMTQIGLQIGSRWKTDNQWIPVYALALRYQHLFRKNIDGSITQYSLPEFTNYSYRWGINSNVVSLYSKMNVVSWGRFMPYVDAGIGVALNRGMYYSEAAYSEITPRVSPAFRSGTIGQLSYNLGLGLDIALTEQLLMSIGYDFQSFGKMQSQNGMTTWSGERLSLGTFKTNTGLVGLTYVLGDSFS